MLSYPPTHTHIHVFCNGHPLSGTITSTTAAKKALTVSSHCKSRGVLVPQAIVKLQHRFTLTTAQTSACPPPPPGTSPIWAYRQRPLLESIPRNASPISQTTKLKANVPHFDSSLHFTPYYSNRSGRSPFFWMGQWKHSLTVTQGRLEVFLVLRG